jgi:hypothetical protein
MVRDLDIPHLKDRPATLSNMNACGGRHVNSDTIMRFAAQGKKAKSEKTARARLHARRLEEILTNLLGHDFHVVFHFVTGAGWVRPDTLDAFAVIDSQVAILYALILRGWHHFARHLITAKLVGLGAQVKLHHLVPKKIVRLHQLGRREFLQHGAYRPPLQKLDQDFQTLAEGQVFGVLLVHGCFCLPMKLDSILAILPSRWQNIYINALKIKP